MCEEANMIENTLLITSAVATIFAALAAWFSFMVSRNSLKFQKDYAKNQNLINELNRTIYTAETLQILIPKPLEMSDTEHESLDLLLNELKSSLERLNNRSVVNYESLKIHSINNHLGLAKDYSCLSEVITELEKIKDGVFK
jgi:predicted mannosyl-3-phosphoglycerate phosphatase (HAD superfamily)